MFVWKKELAIEKAIKYILFLVNPIIGLFYSFKKMNTKSSYNVLFLFFLVFGLSFTVESSFYENSVRKSNFYLDGMHHRADFERYLSINETTFKQILINTFNWEGEKDIYSPMIKFLVSRFTDNYHVFFLVVAFVFAYFSLKTFKFFILNRNYENNYKCYVLAYLFMTIQIFTINNLRFPTAAWIAIYCLFKILIENKNRYIFLLLITPFIHRSFFFFLAIVLIYFLFRKFDKFWEIMFFVSFFIAEAFSVYISSYSHLLPGNLSVWAESYIERQYNFGDGGLFFDIFALFVRWFRYLFVFLLIRNSKNILSDTAVSNMYRFLLVLIVVINMFMPIYGLGSRFTMLLYVFMSYVWLVTMRNKYLWLFYIMPFVYFYQIFYYDPIFLYSRALEPCFYYSSPLYLIYKYLILPI